jgi:CRISPR type I-E-associated protein CasA/Cse1
MPMFRLDQQPWIPVVGYDGLARSVNLVEAFTDAQQIAFLAGSPLEVAAIARFLLAIAHLTETPPTLSAWGELWQNRRGFMDRCSRYVHSQKDAWDLFHDLHPFGQWPPLDKTLNPAHILIYDAARKNNAVLTDHSREAFPIMIPAPALARGIITANAYAGSSGGGYRSGPLSMRTVAFLCGRTLDETILLNLLVQPHSPVAYNWNSYGHATEGGGICLDLVRRYLWTSRRVRLIPSTKGAASESIFLAPGNEMPESERKEDPMVVLRKDAKGTEYVPLRLESGRALWRSAHVLLNWHEDVRRLAAVDQLHRIWRRGLLPPNQTISMRICAVAGDAQGPSTELWRDESLPFSFAVLTEDTRYSELVNAVGTAEKAAAYTRKHIYSFVARYLQDRSNAKPDKDNIVKLTDELSPDLSDFWSELAPVGERIACDGFEERQWAELLKKASQDTFRRALDRLPPDARRYRAEFHRPISGTDQKTEAQKKNQKKGATT